MATAARLSALASVGAGSFLAALTPVGEGSGIVALVGWLAVVYLALGLFYGAPSSVAAVAVIFMVRVALSSVLPFDVPVPLLPTAFLLVLVVEFGAASFTFRSRAADPLRTFLRAVTVALVATGITYVFAELTGLADARGVMVRALGVAALVVAAGWVSLGWRKTDPEVLTRG